MGTDWSKASGGGVVALTLGLALACGGKYSVGSGDTGGQAGEAGTGEPTTGGSSGSSGSSGSAQGGAATGGATTIGGQGGVTAGGTGGASAGGSSAGGNAGASACGSLPVELPEYEAAAPEEVWNRLCRFMHGTTRSPFEPLPETTTVEWVRGRVRALLDEQFVEDGRAPAGFEEFLRAWAFEGHSEANLEPWTAAFARPAGNFSALFAPKGDRVSFMSDRNFLVAHPNSTRRGMWMLSDLLCTPMPGPPPEIDIEPVTVPPGKTRRQTIEEIASDAACAGCHSAIDPLGFSLEHYDALGDYRTMENGLPIDSSGHFEGIDFSSIDDLAGQLAGRCGVQECFAHKLFQYAITEAFQGNVPASYDVEVPYVVYEFRFHYLALGSLVEAIATTPTFLSP